MRVEPFQPGCGLDGVGKAHDGTAPVIRAKQAKLGRGARIHSLGVPTVTADMSSAQPRSNQGTLSVVDQGCAEHCGVDNSVCEAGEPRALALLRACCGST